MHQKCHTATPLTLFTQYNLTHNSQHTLSAYLCAVIDHKIGLSDRTVRICLAYTPAEHSTILGRLVHRSFIKVFNRALCEAARARRHGQVGQGVDDRPDAG